jgi:transporter family-2 protein
VSAVRGAPPRAPAGPGAPVALVTGFAAGSLGAVQARVNGELGERLGSPLVAALVSFGGGLVLVVALVLTLTRTRRALRGAVSARLPWWTYLGGLGGATLVVVAAAAAPVIGVATFTVGLVAGQAVGGLLVDRTPLSAGEPRSLSAGRVAGAVLAVAAVGVVRLDSGGGQTGAAALWLLLASAVAGAGGAVQQALNGRVQRATREPLVATAVNFTVGTVALALVTSGVLVAGAGPGGSWPGNPLLYVGGALGVVVIAVAAWTVHRLGVLRLGLVTVAGQLAGGLVLDLLRPARAGQLGLATVAGVALTLVAVALTGRGPRRTVPAAAPGPA